MPLHSSHAVFVASKEVTSVTDGTVPNKESKIMWIDCCVYVVKHAATTLYPLPLS